MIKMNKMNHILPRLALLPVVAALLAASCNKNTGEGANVALKRQFDAWRAIHYPAAVEKDGIYIIEDIPGNGLEWDDDLPVTFLTYTMRSLDGTVTFNTDEMWARQLGEWDQTYCDGPQVTPTGKDASYAGVDILLEGMREGGTRTAIIPSWMLTYSRYDTLEGYLAVSTDNPATIYTITLLGQTENVSANEFRELKDYAKQAWNVSDTLSTAAVFFKSFSEFEDEPDEMPNDTTVYINYTGRRVYDGQVFDTTIADTAKYYHIYNPSKKYAPVPVTWAEKPTDIKLEGSSVVGGFAHGMYAMHAGEKASFCFGFDLGYGSSGSGKLIPGYAALQFDVELVPEP